MERSPIEMSNFRADVRDLTPLGQLCGTGHLFRSRYEVLKLLGRGGFGVTFLARDRELPGQPLCVIKQLCPKVQDPEAIQMARDRFRQEAKTLAKLGSHSQIPTLLDYFEFEGDFYLVQEYMCGTTLQKEVRRLGRPLPEAEVKRFLHEFLPLLQYVHENHVIHRDIKPPNLLRCRDGRLVLLDFGAVKERCILNQTSIRSTTTTQFVGTVGFAPPEQLSLRPSYASDIYALGVTCLYLLSGKTPLEFDYEFGTGELKWRDLIQVTKYFGDILDKMLRITPQERYQSAKDVLRVLELEPHLETLHSCLSTQPRAIGVEPPKPPSHTKTYLSPALRAATAIREWQSRKAAKQAQEEKRWEAEAHLSSSR